MPINDAIALGQMYPKIHRVNFWLFLLLKESISLHNSLHKEHSKQAI